MKHSVFNFKNLSISWFPYHIPTSKGIVYIPGLPGSFPDFANIEQLQKETSSDVFVILYPGHPQNPKGLLLKEDVSKIVEDFVIMLREGKSVRHLSEVDIIGNSFGASIALHVKGADKIVAISPVVDFQNLYSSKDKENSETLRAYLIKNHYRIHLKGWKDLWSGGIYKKEIITATGEVCVVFSANDPTIDSVPLWRMIKKNDIKYFVLQNKIHTSWKHLNHSVRSKVIRWINSENIILESNHRLLGVALKYLKQGKHGSDLTLLTGSLAAKTAVPESDIDLITISSQTNEQFQKSQSMHSVEHLHRDHFSLATLTSQNIRWVSRIHHASPITGDASKRKRFSQMRRKIIQERRKLVVLFALLERLRYEKRYGGRTPFHAMRIKKGPGGRRSLGFLVYTDSLIHKHLGTDFWSLLQIMITENNLPAESLKQIESFYSTLWRKRRPKKRIIRMMKYQSIIIDQFTTTHILPWLQREWRLQKITILNKRLYISGRVSSLPMLLVDAIWSKEIPRLYDIYEDAVRRKDPLERYCLLYLLAANPLLPNDLATLLIHSAKSSSMSNIRRNIVENQAINNDMQLRHLLLNDPDKKVQYYASKWFSKKPIDQGRILRFPKL